MGLVTITYCGDVERSGENHGHEFVGDSDLRFAIEVCGFFHRRLLFCCVVMFAFAFGVGVALSRFRGGSGFCSCLACHNAHALLFALTMLETRIGPSLKIPLINSSN